MAHWLADVFNHPSALDLVIIAAKSAVVYLFLIAGLRILGKRELGQMTIYDVVLLIVLANSVQNAMVGTDVTLAGGLVAGTTLLILNRVLNLIIARSKHVQHALLGEPLLLVNEGQLIRSHMRREGITREQIMAALREHGLDSLKQARMCVLEIDGTISVVPAGTDILRTKRHFRGLRLA